MSCKNSVATQLCHYCNNSILSFCQTLSQRPQLFQRQRRQLPHKNQHQHHHGDSKFETIGAQCDALSQKEEDCLRKRKRKRATRNLRRIKEKRTCTDLLLHAILATCVCVYYAAFLLTAAHPLSPFGWVGRLVTCLRSTVTSRGFPLLRGGDAGLFSWYTAVAKELLTFTEHPFIWAQSHSSCFTQPGIWGAVSV